MACDASDEVASRFYSKDNVVTTTGESGCRNTVLSMMRSQQLHEFIGRFSLNVLKVSFINSINSTFFCERHGLGHQ